MSKSTLEEKILIKLYASHLTVKHRYPATNLRSKFSGEKIDYLAGLFSVSEQEILDAANKLEEEGLIEPAYGRKDGLLSISGLGIQRQDFTEQIEQMKSAMMVEMISTIIEKELKGADPKNEVDWRNRIADVAQKVITKTAEIAIAAAVKSHIS